MFLVVHKLPNIEVAIGVNFNGSSILLVTIELAFVYLAILADINPLSLPLFHVDQSEVDLALAFDQFEAVAFQEFGQVHVVLGEEGVVCEEFAELLLVHVPNIEEGALLLDCVDAEDFDLEALGLLVHFAVFLAEGLG